MSDNAHLRRDLSKALARRVSAALWNHLVDGGYVADEEINGAVGWDGLVSEARRFLSRDAGRRAVGVPYDPTVPRTFALRREVLEALAVDDARDHPAVVRYRSSALDHPGPLSEEEAAALLASPRARLWSPTIFRHLGVPIIGHDPAWQPPADSASLLGERLEYVVGSGELLRVPVADRAVLDLLRVAAERLTDRYPWHPGTAAAFILEGVTPVVRPFSVRLHSTFPAGRATITIEADAWVPAAMILSAYRDAQRRFLPGHNRPIGRRALEQAAFVLEERERVPLVTWRALAERWDETHSEPYGDWRHFRLAFQRTRRSLLRPSYERPVTQAQR